MIEWVFPGNRASMHPDQDYAYVFSEFPDDDPQVFLRVSVTRFNLDGQHDQGHDRLPRADEPLLRQQIADDGYALVRRAAQDEGLAYFYHRARLRHGPLEPGDSLEPGRQYCRARVEPDGAQVRLSLLIYDANGSDETRYDHLSQQGAMDVRANLVAGGWNWYHTVEGNVYYYQRLKPLAPVQTEAEAVSARAL